MRLNHVELAELERLSGGSGRLSGDQLIELREVREHLQQCTDCAELAETYMFLRQRPPHDDAASDDCPAEASWVKLAASVLPEGEATKLLAHAASCSFCAEKLKVAIEDVGTSEADHELGRLRSSTVGWQESLADRLSTSSRSENGPKLVPSLRRPWYSQPVLWGAVAALLLITLALGVVKSWPKSNDALLASAYDQQRRTALHLPGGEPVPAFSATRGGAEVGPPADLLELKLRAERHLVDNPNDAYWQQVMGRIALVEGDGDEALRKFGVALALDPKLPELAFDMAAAHFEIGETREDRVEFAQAADFFGRAIDDPSETQKALAYFNRGLAWERMSVYGAAAQDYRRALELEKESAWRDVIKKHLEQANDNEQKSEGNLHSDLSPGGFLKEKQSHPAEAEMEYESYLDSATKEWLISRRPHPDAEAALRQLATVGLTHHDAWLRDLLNSPKSALDGRSADHLARGLEESSKGEADQALTELTSSATLYRREGNQAGVLRARVEMVYVSQRMGRSDQCLFLASSLIHNPRLLRYPWLNSYLILETAICKAARGDWTAYAQGIRRALKVSQADGFPLQILREKGLLIECLNALGETKAAWVLAGDGLENCIRMNCSPTRLYQFLQSLHGVVQAQGLEWAAANLEEAASNVSRLVTNVQIRAYAQESLGTAEAAVGHQDKANQAFSRASALLKSMPRGPSVDLYDADWQADRSVLLEREGRVPVAVLRLKQVEPSILVADNYIVRQRHYTELASLLLHMDKPSEALPVALAAVKDAERSLSAATGEAQKLSWERTNRRGYLLLVQSLVQMGKAKEALEAWEWYRSAPYRVATDSAAFGVNDSALPPFRSLFNDRRGLVLIVARLEDFYVVWSSGNVDHSVRMLRVQGSSDRIAEMARTFWELCSDRESSVEDIRVLGNQLYRQLFDGFDDQISAESLLLLDLDRSLQQIPFAALTRDDHHFVNDTSAVVFLPAWWVVRPPSGDKIDGTEYAFVVEGPASMQRSDTSGAISSIPTEYLESDEVAARFPHNLLVKSPQSGDELVQKLLPVVGVFHFSGHTIHVGGQTGLLLSYPNRVLIPSSLDGVSLRHCKLAVLATCSSAGRNDDQIDDESNLVHAFLAAGTANVVGELWDVDSRASRLLMLKFYESLSHSMSIPLAIRKAQLQLRSDPSMSHPFFWSSAQVFSQ